jgi:hypothetical protein
MDGWVMDGREWESGSSAVAAGLEQQEKMGNGAGPGIEATCLLLEEVVWGIGERKTIIGADRHWDKQNERAVEATAGKCAAKGNTIALAGWPRFGTMGLWPTAEAADVKCGIN